MSCLGDEDLAELIGLEGEADPKSLQHLEGCEKCRGLRDALVGLLESLPEECPLPPFAAIEEKLAPVAPVTVKIGCAFCKGALERGGLYCASCLAPHHADCWEEHGSCAACATVMFVRAERTLPKRPAFSRGGFALAATAVAFIGTGVAAFALRWRPVPTGPGVGVFANGPSVRPAPPAPSPAGQGRERVLRIVSLGGAIPRLRHETGPPVYLDAPLAKYAVDRGSPIIAVGRDGFVRSIRPDGAIEWVERDAEFGDPSPGATTDKERIYTATCDAITARSRDGTILWRQTLASAAVTRPVLTPNGNNVVIATVDGELVALDAEAGTPWWRREIEARAIGPPVFVGNEIVVACNDGTVNETVFREHVPVTRISLGQGITAGPIVTHTDDIWVGTGDGALEALRAGPLRRTAGCIASAGAIRHLVPSADGVFFASDLDLGRATEKGVQWRTRLPGPPAGLLLAQVNATSPLVALVVTTEGLVIAHDPATGRELWTCGLHAHVCAPPLVVGEELVVPTFDGRLAFVDITR